MNRIGFTFVGFLLLAVAAVSGGGLISSELELAICGTLILALGIPHGAIDHVLFMKENPVKEWQFYAAYLGSMGIYLLAWILMPGLSLALFLILSAFHFGQSQFSHYTTLPSILRAALSTLWGVAILSALIYYNSAEIETTMSGIAEAGVLLPVFAPGIHRILMLVGSAGSVILLLFIGIKGYMPWTKVLYEVVLFGIIHIAFFILPLLLGFTLYFAILHSLKVLTEEFVYLRERIRRLSIVRFIKLLAPYTLLSVFGVVLLIGASQLGWLNISTVMLLIVAISLLTLPHSFVMHAFYANLYPSHKAE